MAFPSRRCDLIDVGLGAVARAARGSVLSGSLGVALGDARTTITGQA